MSVVAARARHKAIADSALHTLDAALERLFARHQIAGAVSQSDIDAAVSKCVQEAISGLDEKLAIALCTRAVALQVAKRLSAEQASNLGDVARDRVAARSSRGGGPKQGAG